MRGVLRYALALAMITATSATTLPAQQRRPITQNDL